MKALQDHLINAAALGIIGIARLLRYRTRVAFGGFVAGRIIGYFGGYIRKSAANLQWVYPNMTRREARRVARRVCETYGKNLVEAYLKDDVIEALREVSIEGAGLDEFFEARANQRPILLVSGHLGSYEVVRLKLRMMGYETACLYRPASNQAFNQHYVHTLTDRSGPAFTSDERGSSSYYRYLKSGGICTNMIDVRSTQFDDIDFLGKPAPTSTSGARLALKANALVLPCFTHRLDDGFTHRIFMEPSIEHSTMHQMTVDMTQRLERWVTDYPDQWLWAHDRWGTPQQRQQRYSNP